jgi:arylsulfatase A-like enzyme
VSDALVQSTDFAPTILARAGVAPFNGMHGRSLLPLLSGERAAVRDELLVEEEGQRTYLGFESRVRTRSLVTPTHRISLYDGVAWGELYDRGNDPDELANLWDDPGARTLRGELCERLARAMIAHSETSPYPSHIA